MPMMRPFAAEGTDQNRKYLQKAFWKKPKKRSLPLPSHAE
ncbi:hypothetical protein B4135_0608 [Caldibacillus debilis]|uniref:Uncharacterized protein n=1 Tax=Caldibacillus debilis TaxID=301148 RepID=A0A150MFL9_9BACI|nr:hypothetical protein B4135_0608 [Caldibacillus debilis]